MALNLTGTSLLPVAAPRFKVAWIVWCQHRDISRPCRAGNIRVAVGVRRDPAAVDAAVVAVAARIRAEHRRIPAA